MAANDLKGIYYIKNTEEGDFSDITTLVNGVRVLKIDGFMAKGAPKNVYTASWEYEDDEDFAIVMQDSEDEKRIIRECVDIELTFIVRQKYANGTIDVRTQHKTFVDYLTNTDVWIKSGYHNDAVAHCVCLQEYKPTTEKYKRGTNSYVMGTITLHCIEKIS